MKDNVSPEEKLLKLIKGEKKPRFSASLPLQESLPYTKALSEGPSQGAHIKNPAYSLMSIIFSFEGLRRLMIVLIMVSFVYLAASFIYPLIGSNQMKLPATAQEEKTAMPQIEPKSEIKPYEFYLEGLKNKKVFGSQVTQEARDTIASVNNTMDFIKDINLVGIVSTDTPQAVIEDKANQKTYYLTKGQSIGELQIEDIKENKVILIFKGTRYELYL